MMKKRLWATFALALALPHFALALPGLSSALGSAVPGAKDDASCANFSGTWKGSCTVGDHKVENTKTITQQGCYGLLEDGNYDPIGGSSTLALTIPIPDKGIVSVSATGSSDWNKDRTGLDIHYAGLVKNVGKAGVLPFGGSATQRLDGNRMLIDFSVFGTQGSCVYDKQ
jgi:hypothetical protein